MKVWIDQDLCTGDGLCEEIAPAVFTLLDDGLAYVKEGDDVKNEPGGASGVAVVAEGLEDAAQFAKITEGLLALGYAESEIAKILGGNTLRVLAEVETVRGL